MKCAWIVSCRVCKKRIDIINDETYSFSICGGWYNYCRKHKKQYLKDRWW